MPKQQNRWGMLPLLVVLAIITILLILSGGCGCNKSFLIPDNSSPDTLILTPNPVSSSGLVERYHFHPAQQGYSCQVLGDLAEETVRDLFAAELHNGRLVFQHVNVEQRENADLVTRFGVTSSSLMIGYVDETGFHAKNLVGLWYKTGDKQAFRDELSRAVNERLEKRERAGER